MTALGKLLAFALTACSVVALGICFWLYVDYKDVQDRQAKVDNLKNEIQEKLRIQQLEAERLQLLVYELQAGQRQMDAIQEEEGVPFQLATRVPVPVAQVKAQIGQQEAELKQLDAQIAGLQGDITRLLVQLSEARAKTTSGYEEQHRLWEAIHEPKLDGQPQPSFHVLIEQAQEAKQIAEKAQTELRPALINALGELTILQQRHAQLAKRLKELNSVAARR